MIMDTNESRIGDIDKRLIDLELHFMHLQRVVEDLNEAILTQQANINRLKKSVEHVQTSVETAQAHVEAPHRPEDEKPPHY